MTRVRATCDRCGDVEVDVGAVTVTICRDDGEREFSFECPDCALIHRRVGSDKAVDMLIATGARLILWSVPRERVVEPHLGPLTHDDLVACHELLCDDELLATALADILAGDHEI